MSVQAHTSTANYQELVGGLGATYSSDNLVSTAYVAGNPSLSDVDLGNLKIRIPNGSTEGELREVTQRPDR